MVILTLNFFNYVSIFFVMLALIITFVASIGYFLHNRKQKKINRRNDVLIRALLKSKTLRDMRYFDRAKSGFSQNDILFFALRLFENSPRDSNEKLKVFFADQPLQNALINLLKRGKTPQRILAANMLSYYPSDKTFNALKSALSNANQEVCVAAALALVYCDRHISLTDLLIKLHYLIPQKGLFCLLRLLPSDALKELETIISRLETENESNHELITILEELSKNYIKPHFDCVKNDRRKYIRDMSDLLLSLQSTPSGIVRSCHILNVINEKSLQNRVYLLEELITEHFDFSTASFKTLLNLPPRRTTEFTGRS